MEETIDNWYTTGDEIRLRIEIRTEEYPTFVTAVFRAEHNLNQTFTMHDDLVPEEQPPAAHPQRIPVKTYRAELVSLVDVDHQPGVYYLDHIMYGDPAVGTIAYEPAKFWGKAPAFRIVKRRGPRSVSVEAWLMDSPDEDE